MQHIIITITLILFFYLFYSCWFKPLRTIKGYVKRLRERGYNVLYVPFNPFKNDMITSMKKGKEQGDSLKLFKEQRRNYDVIVSNTLTRPRLQFHHPDFIKDYFSNENHYAFPKTENVTNVYDRIVGRGIIFSEGINWKNKRNIFNKVFNFDFVKAQTGQIAKICDQVLEQIQKQSQKSQNMNSVTYQIIKYTVRVFSRVMLTSFMGAQGKLMIAQVQATQFLRKLINDINVQAFTPFNFILGPKFFKLGTTKKKRDIQRNIKIYRAWGIQYLQKRINQIKQSLKKNPNSKQHPNIIQALVLANLKAEKQNKPEEILSIQQIFEQFTSFFIAGTDTTANFAQMMIYQVARHPEVQAKVRQQIQRYIQKQKQSPVDREDKNYSFQNLKKLTYIDLLQKQITRTYGPLNLLFSRKAKQDTVLNGLPIKKGTGLSIFNFSNHYSQKYFKNPQEFRPQRWLNECNQIPSFAVGGFSAGARTCLGKHLAHLQSKIALVKFLKRYKKIILPTQNFKMIQKFMYNPEQFQTKMIINNDQNEIQNKVESECKKKQACKDAQINQ